MEWIDCALNGNILYFAIYQRESVIFICFVCLSRLVFANNCLFILNNIWLKDSAEKYA